MIFAYSEVSEYECLIGYKLLSFIIRTVQIRSQMSMRINIAWSRLRFRIEDVTNDRLFAWKANNRDPVDPAECRERKNLTYEGRDKSRLPSQQWSLRLLYWLSLSCRYPFYLLDEFKQLISEYTEAQVPWLIRFRDCSEDSTTRSRSVDE